MEKNPGQFFYSLYIVDLHVVGTMRSDNKEGFASMLIEITLLPPCMNMLKPGPFADFCTGYVEEVGYGAGPYFKEHPKPALRLIAVHPGEKNYGQTAE